MMELDQYLFLLATGTSLRNLQSSMEPPESPKFSLPLWQPWLASPGKETPSTASSGESEGDRTLSPEAPRAKELTGKWRRERRAARLPDYRPKESKMALRSQSFNERRTAPVMRVQPHSDGEDLSDGVDDAPANLSVNGKAPPEYPGVRHETPIDMRLRARAPPPRPPPPYSRPSVITRQADTPPGSMSMCDPVIDEHFRRSLGDDYMTLFNKKTLPEPAPARPPTEDRASSPIQFNTVDPPKPVKIVAMEVDDASMSVDDHFAKALGDTWKQIQTSRLKNEDKKPTQATKTVVDDHFSKALGDTWKKIQASSLDAKTEEKVKEPTKIISRSGVVI
ncbi:uncharacterized protein LOC105391165 isoform X1 [Plutella xylostella]|uniref:uncharacterized protein LOC105391165 isoform X1 n=1 Tax=Plutella xylostella TaxID=51655 RepID=UPI002032962F|nr:uncharacterized protein LOC105391165 isoform X1 [Plutella xylostella]